ALIFADEPTSALDSGNGQIVIRLLHQAAQERNAAVVVVTHDPRLEGHADRIIGLEDGRIVNDRMISAPPSVPPSSPTSALTARLPCTSGALLRRFCLPR